MDLIARGSLFKETQKTLKDYRTQVKLIRSKETDKELIDSYMETNDLIEELGKPKQQLNT